MKKMTLRALLVTGTLAMAGGGLAAAQAEDLSTYDGAQLFKRLCASCHGADATGNGPVASSLKIQPPDLTRIRARHGGDFPAERVRQIIDGTTAVAPHGVRGMPVWGAELRQAGADPDATLRKLVDYLRSLQAR